MRKKLRLMQVATIVFMVILAVVHFTYLNKPVISSFADLQQSTNRLMAINGKNTPIIKTKQKFRYPDNENGFQFQMWLYKTRLCFVEIDGVFIPVLTVGTFSKTEKMVVLVRPINDELNKKMELDAFKMEHSDEVFADYILVQQRSINEILLMIIVGWLGLKLIEIGLKRMKERNNV
jgi:hypothetical protein